MPANETAATLYARRDTRGYLLDSANNPTGSYAYAQDGECLGALVKYHGWWVRTERDGETIDWNVDDTTDQPVQLKLL